MREVPSLAILRTNAGLRAVPFSLDEEIAEMISKGELPGTQCASCNGKTSECIEYVVECEKLYQNDPSRYEWLTFFLLPFGYHTLTAQAEFTLHGRVTIITLPLAACRMCRNFFLPRSFENIFARLAVFLFSVGLLSWWWHSFKWSLVPLALALGFFLFAKISRASYQRKVKQVISQLSIGQALLKRYPDAEISLVKTSSGRTEGHYHAAKI